MRGAISFETTISSDTIKIPEEYRDAMPSHALVMVIEFEKQGKYRARLGNGVKKISAPHIDTIGWKFNREEANAR
ncbi:hypothetical protein R83H12_00519 [Fibrobacteria bacterium R8-3-H12]